LRGGDCLGRRWQRVLLVSTDPASNLDEVLGQKLKRHSYTDSGSRWVAGIEHRS